eukprot:TRINITY_DN9125_c0_g1_i1.p1 TRINITY_DN9125_c0_g1~~TRINITY_DN9125_c0_g1_i1.p1  ORF type:complete len:359 (-),score=100.50 TRINITY_DN9125_c0_g1_i1:71-1147(-)
MFARVCLHRLVLRRSRGALVWPQLYSTTNAHHRKQHIQDRQHEVHKAALEEVENADVQEQAPSRFDPSLICAEPVIMKESPSQKGDLVEFRMKYFKSDRVTVIDEDECRLARIGGIYTFEKLSQLLVGLKPGDRFSGELSPKERGYNGYNPNFVIKNDIAKGYIKETGIDEGDFLAYHADDIMTRIPVGEFDLDVQAGADGVPMVSGRIVKLERAEETGAENDCITVDFNDPFCEEVCVVEGQLLRNFGDILIEHTKLGMLMLNPEFETERQFDELVLQKLEEENPRYGEVVRRGLEHCDRILSELPLAEVDDALRDDFDCIVELEMEMLKEEEKMLMRKKKKTTKKSSKKLQKKKTL